jgi:hypothetical protein
LWPTTKRRSKKNLGSRILKTLSKSNQKKGRNITVDNFFTSSELGGKMLNLSTTIFGKLNAKFHQLKPNKQKKSSHQFIFFAKI